MSTPQDIQHVENQTSIVKLTGRVDNLESGLKNVLDAVHGLSAKFDSKSQTNWSVLIALAGVLLTAGYFIYNNQSGSVRELQSSLVAAMKEIQASGERSVEKLSLTLEKVNARFDNFVTAKALDDRFKAVDDLREAKAEKALTAISDLKIDVEALKAKTITRSEHEEHWKADQGKVEGIQRQVDRNTADLHDMYSARDAIQQLLNWKTAVEAKQRAGS